MHVISASRSSAPKEKRTVNVKTIMENRRDTYDRRPDSCREKCTESTTVKGEILWPRNLMADYAKETEARTRQFEKHPKENYPEFPERRFDSVSREIALGCNSSSSTKYQDYDNLLYDVNLDEAPKKNTRCTDSDYEDEEYEEETICSKSLANESNRNCSSALVISNVSSECNDSDRSWEEPPEECAIITVKSKSSKKAGKGFTRRIMKSTHNPNAGFRDKLSYHHENWASNETLPDFGKQSEVSTKYQKQNYNESYDRDFINGDFPYSYRSSPATVPAYDKQLCTAKTDALVTKFTSIRDTDHDDRQTEEHMTYEEPKSLGRRKVLGSSRVVLKSGSSGRQQAGQETYCGTGLNNRDGKRRDGRTREEVKLMNQVDNRANICFHESSDYSDDNELYTEKTNRAIIKLTGSAETDDDDRKMEHRTYDEPKIRRRKNDLGNSRVIYESGSSGRQQPMRETSLTLNLFERNKFNVDTKFNSENTETDDDDAQIEHKTYDEHGRKRNVLSDSREIFKPCISRQQQPTKETNASTSLRKNGEEIRNRRVRWETKQMNQTDKAQCVYPQEELSDYSDDCGIRRNETLPDSRRQYCVGNSRQHYLLEDNTREYSGGGGRNPTFSAKTDHICNTHCNHAESRVTKSANQSIIHPSRWENENPVERNSSETGAERWGTLEWNREISLNRDRDHMNLVYADQERKRFVDKIPCCGHEESREMVSVAYFKREIQGGEERDPQKSYHRRANDVHTETQLYQWNRWKNPSRCNCPAFSSGDHPHAGHSFPNSERYSERQEPRQDDHYENKDYGRCYVPVHFENFRREGTEDGGYVRNSNSERLVENDWDGSAYFDREHGKPGFTIGNSFSGRYVNQRRVQKEKSASRSTSGTENTCRNSYGQNPEEQVVSSLDPMSSDSRLVHESNMSAVQNTVIADLITFGSKMNDAIRSCHVSLQLFKATYGGWLKARNDTLTISRALESEIRAGGDWKAGFTMFCEFMKTIGVVAEEVLNLTPYRHVAVPILKIIPVAIQTMGNMIIDLVKRNKKEDTKFRDMFQIFQTDIEESWQLKMFALQCEIQFKETEGLFVEFLDAVLTQQMADCIEDMGLLNFIIDLSDAKTGCDGFFRHISDAYRKFHNTCNGESSTTCEAFCNFIDSDPSVLETLQCIDWQFTKSFLNQSEENDLCVCWNTISNLASTGNTSNAEDALSKISSIIRILETQSNYVNANVSRLFKDP